ncbi:MAG TPA: hypothetical protein VGQ62_06890 [Chloroflexota bacterium]|jgi:hypothetical protein|nr:hypothetical protein [Chloroflexota bacterium]
MHSNLDGLYDDFEQAQRAAVEVTDRYRDTPADDPRRASLWGEVVSRTERSATLLRRWLAETADRAPVPHLGQDQAAREPEAPATREPALAHRG